MRRAKRLDMTLYPRDDDQRQEGAHRRKDVMDAQDNTRRGDGESIPKTMTTFQMETALKNQVKAHCRSTGLKLGEFLNQAARLKLETDRNKDI